jgi:2',3'-cyclic-nucleotide 2'-phosphodiesterase (5'-nucleotidase family)
LIMAGEDSHLARVAVRTTIAGFLLSLLFTSGCSKSPQNVSIFVSGDTAGWITPCGCTSNQSGGLARRASLINDARDTGPVVAVDVGGAVAGHSPYDFLKLRAILAGQMQMGLDAFNLGGPETQFTAAQLRQLREELQVPFVSANVMDSQGNAIAPSLLTLERGGQTIAITGVVDPQLVGDDLQATDPYRCLYDAIRHVAADRIIVLAYLETRGLKELARRLPDVDAVVGGPTGQVVPPDLIGHVLVGSSTNKGKFLLQMQCPPRGTATAEIVEVSSSIKESAEQKRNLKLFYEQLAQADFPPTETQFVSTRLMGAAGQQVAGSGSCQLCHRPDDAVWHDSKHAHA